MIKVRDLEERRQRTLLMGKAEQRSRKARDARNLKWFCWMNATNIWRERDRQAGRARIVAMTEHGNNDYGHCEPISLHGASRQAA